MRGWQHDCAGLSLRWQNFFQKDNRRWMLLVIAVVLLLCWDAGFPQDCTRAKSCSDLFSNQASKAFSRPGKPEKIQASFKSDQDSHVQLKQKRDPVYLDGSTTGSVSAGTLSDSMIEAAISFNDSVLLVLDPPHWGLRDAVQQDGQQLQCVFARGVRSNVLSVEDNFVRCEHPPSAHWKSSRGSIVTLQLGGLVLKAAALYGKVSWKKVVYAWVPLMDQGDALLFVKGLSHSKRSMLPSGLECQYGDNVKTQVVAFCQENVRCKLPPRQICQYLMGKKVTITLKEKIFPSAVKFALNYTSDLTNLQSSLAPLDTQKQYFLCACTLVWNGAKFLKEWVIYHGHVGVQRFFFYDNNSDDYIQNVLDILQFYNVSRHPWPWLKTQEASFAHCAVRASSECSWVAFIDLDEFIFPRNFLSSQEMETSGPPIHKLIKQYDDEDMGKLGQLKIPNFNFGPSGLTTLPKSGQMVNYICRMSSPRRVKSIVRASAISPSYCSRVHHFELKPHFVSTQAARKDAVIHHYKYQVWEDFKLKFVRRAATFVTDWGQNKDLDSFDRTPGLGTEALEPSDWGNRFCEVEDTALRDYVTNASMLHVAGKLIWE